MKIKITKNIGFCWGVRRAINLVIDKRKRTRSKMFVLGELIHNPKVVEFLNNKGVKTEKDLKKIPDNSIVVIRSHGTEKNVYEEIKKRNLILLDATCPKVKRVHEIVKKHFNRGDNIIIVGDRGHAEVKGLFSFTDNKGIIIEKYEDLKKLPADDGKKWIAVAQTTQSVSFYKKVTDSLAKKYKNFKYYNTICLATYVRQQEVRNLAKTVDIVVVVGGKNSANTHRLAEIAKEEGAEAIHIENETELPDLRKYEKIGVTAGASTPHWVTKKVISKIEDMSKNKTTNFLYDILRFIVRSNLYVASGAAALSYTACRMQGIEPKIIFEFIAATYIFSIHLFNQLSEWFYTQYLYPERVKFIEKNRKLLLSFSFIGIITSVFFSFFLGLQPFILILAMILLGLLYRFPFKKFKLSDIPGSKDIFMAGAWAIFLVLLHLLSVGSGINTGTIIAFIYVFLLSLYRSFIISYKDLQIDTILGRESLSVWFGEINVKYLIFIMPFLIVGLMVAAYFITSSSLFIFLIAVPLYMIFISYLTITHYLMRELLFNLFVDGTFYLGGIITYLWKLIYIGF